jgi:macrolide-specific efflux system membrane fusion protein
VRTATSGPSWRRRLQGLVAVVALVAVGAVGGWWWGSRDTATTASATERTRLVAAALGTVKQSVSATGTIEPAHQSTAWFTSSGTVTSVAVAVGDKVTKGQRLATIDASTLADAVTLAQASVSAAQDQVNSSTTSDAIASAKAQLASAQSQLADARTALAGATLRAPLAGTVASVGLAVGDNIGNSGATGGGGAGATSSSSSGIEVVNTSSWVVNATVSSGDLGQLKKGLQATITPSGASVPIFGTVRSVGVVASSSSSGTAEFPVVIDVTGHPSGLYAGTTATVAITVKQLTDVLTVPTLAVRTTNGRTTVQLSKNGVVTTVPVTVGGVYGTTTEITEGLSEGDEVVVTVRSFTGPSTSGSSGTQRTRTGFPGGDFPGGGLPGGRPPGGGAP